MWTTAAESEHVWSKYSGEPKLSLAVRNQDRVAVVSMAIEGFDAQQIAAILDQTFGIETRAGLNCASGAHRAIRSFDCGGTVRLSVRPSTTSEDITATIEALRQIAATS